MNLLARARFAVLAVLLALLVGCGGGDDDEDMTGTQPVDCKARPEVCR